jgi:hypothetical protein
MKPPVKRVWIAAALAPEIFLLLTVAPPDGDFAGSDRQRRQDEMRSPWDLDWTDVGDAGLAELTTLPRLWNLSLWGARQVTDAGVEHLTRIQTLSHLDLKGTAVTDEGVKHLAKLSRLRYLSLPTPKVTLQAAQEVSRALPECSVYLDYANVKQR